MCSQKITGSFALRSRFNAADSSLSYIKEEFFKICEDYEVSCDPVRYRDSKIYSTYQQGVKWPDDYIGPDSMTRKISAFYQCGVA